MWSGFKASGAQLKKFKHNSIENLELLLKQAHKAALSKSPNGSDKTIGDFRSKKSTKNLEEETDNFSLLSPNLDVIVAIEGLYSMEGTIPDMLAIQKLKEKYKFKV